MPNLVGIGNSQTPTNAMLGGMAYQDPAHANLTSVEIENIAAIKAYVDNSIYDVFIYNTSKDSDGGAWRHRCRDKSWYKEALGTSIRGHRREFPSIAIIFCYSTYCIIYDGDDPNCPMWMRIDFAIGSGNNMSICMLNGELVIGASNNGCAHFNFVADRIQLRNHAHLHTFNQGIFPVRKSRTDYNSLTEDSSSPLGDPTLENEYVNHIDMAIEPGAAIDPATGIQKPSILISCGNNNADGGLVIVRGTHPRNHNVIRRGTNSTYDTDLAKFTPCGNYYYWNSDYSPSTGHANMIKRSHVSTTGIMYDFYNTTDGVLAQSYWYINRTDTAHDEVGNNYGVFNGAGNCKVEELVTWESNEAAMGSNGAGITQWKLYEDPSDTAQAKYDSILYNWIGHNYNSGWMPNRTIFNYINCDNAVGTISNGTNITSHAAYQLSMPVTGSLTCQTVNVSDSSDLKCFSGFTSSNYMRKTGTTRSFGSGASFKLCLMGWIKISDISAYSYLASIHDSTSDKRAGIAVHISGNRGGQVYAYDNSHPTVYSDSNNGTLVTVHNGEWHHVCAVWNGDTEKILYVNGRRVASVSSSMGSTNFSAADGFAVGQYYFGSGSNNDYHCLGHLSLIKFINGNPTAEQIEKIYFDERQLFYKDTKCTLTGSSNDIFGMAHDSSTGILHVGNSTGRCDFDKLVRVHETSKALSDSTDQMLAAEAGIIVEHTTS